MYPAMKSIIGRCALTILIIDNSKGFMNNYEPFGLRYFNEWIISNNK